MADADASGPSTEPADLVSQFRDICAVDDDVARLLLEESSWNLQAAIHRYLSNESHQPAEDEDTHQDVQAVLHHLHNAAAAQQTESAHCSLNEQLPREAEHENDGIRVRALPADDGIRVRARDPDWVELDDSDDFDVAWPAPERRREDSTSSAQREVESIELNQLRREQEAEYEQALQADRERMNEQRRQETEWLEAGRREQEERGRKLERLNAKKDEIRAQLQKQNQAATNDVSAEQTVRVSVRFPGGDKFDSTFHLDDSLEALFNATLVHECCPEDFSLLSSYPRTELNCAPEWYREFGHVQDPANIPTFRQSGLERSVVVLVRDNKA